MLRPSWISVLTVTDGGLYLSVTASAEFMSSRIPMNLHNISDSSKAFAQPPIPATIPSQYTLVLIRWG